MVDFAETTMAASPFQLGNARFRAGDYVGAAALYERSITAEPKFVPAWSNKLRCLIRLDLPSEAMAFAERLLEYRSVDVTCVQDILILSRHYHRVDFEILVSRKSRIDPWVTRVYSLTNALPPHDRKSKLEHLVEEDPSLYITHHLLGDSLFAERDYAAAARCYRAACQRKADFGWSWFNLAKALQALRLNFSERLDALTQAAALMRESLYASSVLRPYAEHLACTRRVKEAVAVYLEVASLEPSGDAALWAVETLMKCRGYSEALRLAPLIRERGLMDHWSEGFLEWAEHSQPVIPSWKP